MDAISSMSSAVCVPSDARIWQKLCDPFASRAAKVARSNAWDLRVAKRSREIWIMTLIRTWKWSWASLSLDDVHQVLQVAQGSCQQLLIIATTWTNKSAPFRPYGFHILCLRNTVSMCASRVRAWGVHMLMPDSARTTLKGKTNIRQLKIRPKFIYVARKFHPMSIRESGELTVRCARLRLQNRLCEKLRTSCGKLRSAGHHVQ